MRLTTSIVLLGFIYLITCSWATEIQPRSGASQRPEGESVERSQNTDAVTDDPQTEETLTFTGFVVRENEKLVLRDPITKLVYQLDDPSKARQFIGKQVKVVGRLALNSNTIHVTRIEVRPGGLITAPL